MADRALAGSLALRGDWDLGEDGWKAGMDENLLKLSALAQAVALDFVAATPGAPAEGDIYLFDSTHPTEPNVVAIYDEGAWSYLTPEEGWLVYDTAGETMRMFNGAAWETFSSGSGGGGGASVAPPVLLQKGVNRGGGTLALPAAPTPGNLMVILATGFSTSTAYKPANFQLIGQYQSDVNNLVYCWAKRVVTGDTGSYTGIAVTGDKQAVIYEFANSDGVLPVTGGAMSTWSGTAFSQPLLPHPLAPNAVNLFAAETDTAVTVGVTPEAGWSLDYATPAATSTNHYAVIGRIGFGFDGILAGTSSSGPTQQVFGYFAVQGSAGVPSQNGLGDLIAEYVCLGGETTISFANIPSSYRDLEIVADTRTVGAAVRLACAVNGDSGNNYVWSTWNRFAPGSATTGLGRCGRVAPSTAPALMMAPSRITCFDYARAVGYKNLMGMTAIVDDYTTSYVSEFFQMTWKNTAPITSLAFSADTGVAFAAGSVIRVYGKGGTTGTGGTNKPWYWKPPAAASFTLFKGGANDLILTDDPDLGLRVNSGVMTAGDNLRIAARTLTNPALDWELACHFDNALLQDVDYANLHIFARDTVSGRLILASMGNRGPIGFDKWNSLTSFNAAYATTINRYDHKWFKIKSVGSVLTFQLSGNGKDWNDSFVSTPTNFLTNRADQVGFGILSNRAIQQVSMTVDHFSLTGPAV